MGSGFSACTGPTSVGVAETGRRTQQTLNKSGGVHSDSCDSGISISEGNRKCKARHSVTSRHAAAPDLDSEEEGVAGADVACGTDFLMTSTPRPAAPKLPGGRSGEKSGASVGGGQDEAGQGEVDEDRTQGRSASKSLKHSPNSAPNLLLDHAIHEEDEEAHDGEPEDKRLRAQRPPRPKSAHFRKSRAQAHRSRTAHSLSRPQAARASAGGSLSGGESSADNMSSDEGEEDFDSDILSIPDETSQQQQQQQQPGGSRGRPNTLTTIKLGPQFQAQTKIHDGAATTAATTTTTTHTHNNTTTTTIADSHDLSNNDSMDWWTEDDGASSSRAKDSCRSRGSSFTLPSSGRGWPEGRVAKKASERSISSILLTTAVELDTAPVSASADAASASAATTNPACFAVTNPEITQHILKVSTGQSAPAARLLTCMRNFINTSGDSRDAKTRIKKKPQKNKKIKINNKNLCSG